MPQKSSENFSDLFKKRFLIEFTKELIKNSATEVQFGQREENIEIPKKHASKVSR